MSTTETKVRYTPGPWAATVPPSGCLTTRFIQAEDGTHIAKVGHMDFSNGVFIDVANADYIVRAVNSHADMLEALEGLLAHRECPVNSPEAEIARATIKKAKG